jgi:lipopolysaccharide/colanic/teichoic acid biosynthesis glycosyltransferase
MRKSRLDLIKQFELENKERVQGHTFIKLLMWRASVGLAYFMKRAMDILFAVVVMLLFLPFHLIIAFIIFVELPQKAVIYKQKRVGKNGRYFWLYKYRTMVANADKIKLDLMNYNESKDGVIFKIKKDPRITPFGRILRKTSLDEMPQFINIFKGEMTLIGPRPPLPQEVKHYSLEQMKKLDVKPGLTGLWQISGRSDIPFKKQIRLDLEYIKSQSFYNDFKIVLKTIPAIIFGKGAY